LSIFPEVLSHYLAESVLGRAQRQGLVEFACYDLRDGADDARRSVDDAPFGGGAGMVLAPEPVATAVERLDPPRPIYLMSPSGRRFDQRLAERLAASGGFSLLCARYEGVDQRVVDELCEDEISVGDYVLAGGELAALVVTEAVCRLVPGVLGNEASSGEESFADGLLEYPHYTRPATFHGEMVPDVLLSGDHQRIAAWRHAASLARTLERRPDLITARGGLSQAEVQALLQHGYPLPASAAGPEPSKDLSQHAASTEERDQQ
jgi:tRNA (guanine37-N1)-methyltransferase